MAKKWPNFVQKTSFSNLGEILHLHQFLCAEFENEVHFLKFCHFDPSKWQKMAKFLVKTLRYNLMYNETMFEYTRGYSAFVVRGRVGGHGRF